MRGILSGSVVYGGFCLPVEKAAKLTHKSGHLTPFPCPYPLSLLQQLCVPSVVSADLLGSGLSSFKCLLFFACCQKFPEELKQEKENGILNSL